MKTLLILFSTLVAFIFTLSIVEAADLPGWISLAVTGVTMIAGSQLPQNSLAITCGAITMGADINCDFPVTAGTNDVLYLVNYNDITTVTRDTANPLIITGITLLSSVPVKDNTILVTGTGAWHVGETVKGGTSNATATLESFEVQGSNTLLTVSGIRGTFSTSESVTGLTSSASGTLTAQNARAYVFNGQLGSLKPKWSVVKQTYTRPYDHEVDFLVFDATAGQKQNLAQLARGRVVAIVIQNYGGDANNSSKIEIYGLDTGMIVDTMIRDLSKVDTQSAIEIMLKTADNVKEPRPAANYFNSSLATSLTDIASLVSA